MYPLLYITADRLAPLFLAPDGTQEAAKAAAIQAINAYNPRSSADILLVARILALSLAAIAAAGHSEAQDLSATQRLNYLAKANTLSRSAAQAEAALAKPHRQPGAVPGAVPGAAPNSALKAVPCAPPRAVPSAIPSATPAAAPKPVLGAPQGAPPGAASASASMPGIAASPDDALAALVDQAIGGFRAAAACPQPARSIPGFRQNLLRTAPARVPA